MNAAKMPWWANWKPLGAGLALGLVAGIALLLNRAPPCAFGAAECPVASTSVFSQDIGVQGGTTFTTTLTSIPTAARTWTLPDATDTMVGRATTDTLTNKTLTTPTIAATGWVNANHAHAAANSGGQISLTDITGTLPIARGGTNSTTALNNNRVMVSSEGSIGEAGAMTNGQLIVGSSGAAPVVSAITGTANQVTVTNGAGSITLSAPQNLATASTPQFLRMGLNQAADSSARMAATGQYFSTRFALTDGGTIALNWDNGNVQSVTLAGNRTFTFANPKDGGRYVIIVAQDATGSRTVTWPTIKWGGGTAPTLTTTANKKDIIVCIYDSADYLCSTSLNY